MAWSSNPSNINREIKRVLLAKMLSIYSEGNDMIQ